MGRSTKVLRNIKIPPLLNSTFNWEDHEYVDDDDDNDDDNDDDDDALPVVIARKAQAFAVYIY